MSKNVQDINAKNAEVMAKLIADSQTSEHLGVILINKLLEAKHDEDFFPTMLEEKMSFGECPECGHKNHWLIPEVELNKFGWVTFEEDNRVQEFPNENICPEWHESCFKKKTTI